MDRPEPGFAEDKLGDVPPALDPREDDDVIVTFGDPMWDVVEVKPVGPLTLWVRFEDGLEGKVRFEPGHLRGPFARLSDPAYFEQVGILYGAVSWPNEEPDLAPDAMYDEIAEHGEWVLD